MDLSRGKMFCESLCRSPVFRSKFGGLYVSVTNALERLGVKDVPTPSFIQEKITKAHAALKDEERLLAIMRAEVTAREARVDMLRSTLERAENKEWEPLIGFETRIPPLPRRPACKRARKTGNVPRTNSAGAGSERGPAAVLWFFGGQRPALSRTNAATRTRSLSKSRDQTDRSRSTYREYPPRPSSTTRRRR